MTRELVLDPTGATAETADRTLSARTASLRGLTVGLLDNTKPNTTDLLRVIGDELQRSQVDEQRRHLGGEEDAAVDRGEADRVEAALLVL